MKLSVNFARSITHHSAFIIFETSVSLVVSLREGGQSLFDQLGMVGRVQLAADDAAGQGDDAHLSYVRLDDP